MSKPIGPEPAASLPDQQSAHGVFVLIDVCGFTPQSARLGSDATARYTAHLRDELGKIAAPLRFTVFKTAGDAVFLFRASTEPGNAARALLDLFLRVGENAPQLSAHGFEFVFRMIAHESHFAIVLAPDGHMQDIAGSQAIRLFRSEKFAAPGELLITNEAAALCHEAATRDAFRIEPMKLDTPLKGLESEGYSPVYYRLRPPISRLGPDDELPKPYLAARDTLRGKCKEIPVFGEFSSPIPMERNFIHLHLSPTQTSGTGIDWDALTDARHSHSRKTYISTEELYRAGIKGVIFGLPGAGKTTILRYLAHCTLRDDPASRILFISCGTLTTTHCQILDDPRRTPNSVPAALRALLTVFLFPGDLAANIDLALLTRATEVFVQSWKENRLTVLIDALDEATTPDLRERLTHWALDLLRSITVAPEPAIAEPEDFRAPRPDAHTPAPRKKTNRVFLTSRRTHILIPGLDEQPVSDVTALDLGELQALATHFFTSRNRLDLATRFYNEIPRQPAAIKLGGTPLTGLLLAFYYEGKQTWDSRYVIYDRIVKFVILQVWQDAKPNPERRRFHSIREFFHAIESLDFPERYPEEHALFQALTAVAWEYLYQNPTVERRIREDDLVIRFKEWLNSHPAILSQLPAPATTGDPIAARAHEWFRFLKAANLFIPDDPPNYHFIHSTVLEFLAAAHLRQSPTLLADIALAVAKPDRDTLDTLPMLCGADWELAHRLLPMLRDTLSPASLASALPYRCLAETELAEHRAIERHLLESIRQPLQRRMDETLSKDWAYQRLSDWLFKSDAPTLAKLTTEYGQSVPLIRDTFPQRYTDSEEQRAQLVTSEARLTFLKTILHKDLRDRYVPRRGRPQGGGTSRSPESRSDSPTATPQGNPFGDQGAETAPLPAAGASRPREERSDSSSGIGNLPSAIPPIPEKGIPLSWKGIIGRPTLAFGDAPPEKIPGKTAITFLRTLTGHKDSVLACAWSSSGHNILSASYDKTLKLWESDTARELRTFAGHEGAVYTCAWNLGERNILSASGDNTLKLWKTTINRELLTFTGHTNKVIAGAWHPDGRYILSASYDHTIKLWEADTDRELRTFTGHTSGVVSCAWSPDGQYFLTGSLDNTLKLWKTSAGLELRTFTGHKSSVWACAWSPDGQHILSGSEDGTLKLWPLAPNTEPTTQDLQSGTVRGFAIHPTTHHILAVTYGDDEKSQPPRLIIFDKHLTTELCRTDLASPAYAIAIHGQRIVIAHEDGTLTLWQWTAE